MKGTRKKRTGAGGDKVAARNVGVPAKRTKIILIAVAVVVVLLLALLLFWIPELIQPVLYQPDAVPHSCGVNHLPRLRHDGLVLAAHRPKPFSKLAHVLRVEERPHALALHRNRLLLLRLRALEFLLRREPALHQGRSHDCGPPNICAGSAAGFG